MSTCETPHSVLLANSGVAWRATYLHSTYIYNAMHRYLRDSELWALWELTPDLQGITRPGLPFCKICTVEFYSQWKGSNILIRILNIFAWIIYSVPSVRTYYNLGGMMVANVRVLSPKRDMICKYLFRSYSFWYARHLKYERTIHFTWVSIIYHHYQQIWITFKKKQLQIAGIAHITLAAYSLSNKKQKIGILLLHGIMMFFL